MATDRQIAANRANAKKSTGPRTQAGRARSSQNARTHGLSSKSSDPKNISESQPTCHVLTEAEASSGQLDTAHGLFWAQARLARIAEWRRKIYGDLESSKASLSHVLVRRFAALDRYERYAYTQLYRAIAKLEG